MLAAGLAYALPLIRTILVGTRFAAISGMTIAPDDWAFAEKTKARRLTRRDTRCLHTRGAVSTCGQMQMARTSLRMPYPSSSCVVSITDLTKGSASHLALGNAASIGSTLNRTVIV
jgi:hypothetical protein